MTVMRRFLPLPLPLAWTIGTTLNRTDVVAISIHESVVRLVRYVEVGCEVVQELGAILVRLLNQAAILVRLRMFPVVFRFEFLPLIRLECLVKLAVRQRVVLSSQIAPPSRDHATGLLCRTASLDLGVGSVVLIHVEVQ